MQKLEIIINIKVNIIIGWSKNIIYRRMKYVNYHRYLGVELSYDLKWAGHLKEIVAKPTRLLGILYRVLKTANTKTRRIAYYNHTRPILKYEYSARQNYLEKMLNNWKRARTRRSDLSFDYRVANIQLIKSY